MSRWTEAELTRLRQLVEQGLSIVQCAKRLGCTRSSAAWAITRLKTLTLETDDTARESRQPYHPPKPAQMIGPIDHIQPDEVAARVIRALSDLGALMLICERGHLIGAIPGSRPAQRAEARGPDSIVGTYWIHGATRKAIAEDIRAARGGAA